MKTIKINNDRNLNANKIIVGFLQENNVETIKFEIPEEYESYSKRVCFKTDDGTFSKLFDDITSNYLTLTNDITKYQELDMSVEFIDSTNEVVARTSILHIIVKDSVIDTNDVKPDEPQVVILNELIDEVSKLDLDLTDNILTITKKDGSTKSTNVKGEKGEQGIQGEQGVKGDTGAVGSDGKPATINGINAINIIEGNNINLEQENETLKINCTQTAPKIINEKELTELHNQTGSMASGQIWCGSFYTLYGDGLYYLNVECGISNTKESVSDKCYKGTTIQVMNDGHLIMCYASNMANAIKVFKTSSYIVDLNSNYSLVNITADKIYELSNKLSEDTILTINNQTSYIPTNDNQPTPKKYVDDKVTAERSIYYAEIFASNWYDASILQPILDLAYKGGYDDVFIKIKDGTRYIQCAGLSLQTLSTSSSSTFMWANLKYITGSSTTPNTIFYGYACANGVKLDENGNVSIDTTGLKQGSVKVMKDTEQITGYDKTKTQVLKHINGVLQWVSE